MNQDDSSAHSLRDRGNLLLALVFVALLASTCFVAFRTFMRWKNERLATEVVARASRGEFDAAEKALVTLRPAWVGESLLLRARLSVWTVTDPARALAEADPRFDALPRGTQMLAAELALRSGNDDRAATMLDSLSDASAGDNEIRFLRSWLAITRKDYPVALANLRDLLASDPTHRGAVMLRSRLLLESPNYVDVVRARADLRTLSSGRDLLGLESLIARALTRKAVEDPGERREVFQAIVSHPLMRHVYFLRQPETLMSLLAASDGVPPADVLPLSEHLYRLAPENPRAVASQVFFLQELHKATESAPLVTKLEALDPKSESTMQLRCRQSILERRPLAAIEALEAAGPEVAASARMAPVINALAEATQDLTVDVRRRALQLGLALPKDNFLAWLTLRYRALDLFPERRAEFITEVRTEAHGDRAVPAAEWLLLVGDFDAAIAAARPAAASGDEKARLILFEGLLALKDFANAEAEIGGFPIESTQGVLTRARLAKARDNTSSAAAIWRNGYDRARRAGDFSSILQLAAGAGRIGLLSEASEAFDQVSERIAANTLACNAETAAEWLKVELRLGNSRAALTAARLLVAKSPGRTAAQIDGRFWESYLGLLLGDDLLGAKDTARALNDELPADRRFHALYALAQVKTGQAPLALSTLEREIGTDAVVAATLPLQVRIIAAAVCAANGRDALAEQWRQTFGHENLLPEEKAIAGAAANPPLALAR